ncbi:protein of unknown function [Micromonospora pattaloongensis]|uniref:DUF4178 domain-containing protein n=1 Tax=Micromonospora pattaloongensis TaxID=405436 RepID=A0A1H3I4A7_9ACTN|nr:DUF4178 domain-containing protein [Micromonospora pattaloongensis]SDY22523.1 protein of unknown function [Micromonospora pattaloongensis]
MNGTVAFLVTGLGCLVAVAGVVVAVVAVRRADRGAGPARKGTADPFRSVDDDADALRGDPRRIGPGDIVEIRGTSYGVRGTLRFTEGAWSWAEHLLDDAQGRKVWLSVEEDPDLELALWTEVPSATVKPGAATVDFDGRRYTRDESGRARYTATGTTGLDPTGTVRYHDYAAPDGALLSFESYGDSTRWEVGRGERLHRGEVMIYPQSERGR